MTVPLPKVNCYRIRAHTQHKGFLLEGQVKTRDEAKQAAYYHALDHTRTERWLELADGGRLRSSQVVAYTVDPWYDPKLEGE